MSEAIAFHYRPADSFLTRRHPLSKLVPLLLISLLLTTASPLRTGLLGILMIGCAIGIRLPLRHYLRESFFFFILAAALGISQWFSSKLLLPSLTAAVRFLFIILAGIMMADTTAPDDIARATGCIAHPLLGARGWRFAASIELTLSILPMIFDVSRQSREARTARGETGWKHPVKRISGYIITLFSLLLDRMEDLSLALEARAFDPDKPRPSLPWTRKDTLFFFCSFFILFGVILLERSL